MKDLPYASATSGDRALGEAQSILSRFGCTQFGIMHDTERGELRLQFVHQGRTVDFRASWKGYAAAWLKAKPYTHRMRGSRQAYEAKAIEQAKISVCSVLRDLVKAQVTAIEAGILSFEGAFLGQILLASGQSVSEYVQAAAIIPPAETKKLEAK